MTTTPRPLAGRHLNPLALALTRLRMRPPELSVLAIGVAVAVAARIAHWAIADRVWEDALITLAHVRNAVEGNGLTHHLGEGLVHGFTSALSVLVPLVGELVSAGSGLTTLRIASVVAGAVAVGVGCMIAHRLGAGTWGIGFVASYLALDQLQIFFGMSGMETQIATAILLAGSAAVLWNKPVAAGMLAGVGVLARPDFLLWAAIVALWSARRGWGSLAVSTAGTVAVAGPWIVFTIVTYGSPIPQTIVAKGLAYPAFPSLQAGAGEWLAWVVERGSFGVLAVIAGVTPFFEDGLTVAAPIGAGLLVIIGLLFVAVSAIGIVVTRRRANWWPTLLYLAGFTLYWVMLLPLGYFMWYQPPFLALVAVLAAVGITKLRDRWRRIGSVATLLLVVGFSLHLPWSIPLDHKTQLEIEDGVRREAGIYLGDVVSQGESVTSEAAGYPGWYGRVELWDYPGLTSPTALEAVRSLEREERTLPNALHALQPDWLLVRPHEWQSFAEKHPDTSSCYEEQMRFGVPSPSVVQLNGLVRWNQDHVLVVYRRDASCRG